MRYSGTAQEFIQSLPWTLEPIIWQGKSGVWKLDDERIATIKLNTSGTHGHYTGVAVDITSKLTGKIKEKWFNFDEYLDRNDRTDNRTADYPHGNNSCYCVIDHCGWQWYIAIPKHPERFTKAVELWICCWI